MGVYLPSLGRIHGELELFEIFTTGVVRTLYRGPDTWIGCLALSRFRCPSSLTSAAQPKAEQAETGKWARSGGGCLHFIVVAGALRLPTRRISLRN